MARAIAPVQFISHTQRTSEDLSEHFVEIVLPSKAQADELRAMWHRTDLSGGVVRVEAKPID